MVKRSVGKEIIAGLKEIKAWKRGETKLRTFTVELPRVRSTWARLIHKVYEVDPLECPHCKGPMRVIALIDDKAVIRKILGHLGPWVAQIATGRGLGRPRRIYPGQPR